MSALSARSLRVADWKTLKRSLEPDSTDDDMLRDTSIEGP